MTNARWNEALRIAGEDWALATGGKEWNDIASTDEWLRGYLPYQDESPRTRGTSLAIAGLRIFDQQSDSPRLMQALLGLPTTPWKDAL